MTGGRRLGYDSAASGGFGGSPGGDHVPEMSTRDRTHSGGGTPLASSGRGYPGPDVPVRKRTEDPSGPRLTLHDLAARLRIVESRRDQIDNHPDDIRWNCEKCRSMIALVDRKLLIIRIHDASRGLFARVPLVDNVDIVCRRCGERNLSNELVESLG